MSTMKTFNTAFFLPLVLLFLSACSNEEKVVKEEKRTLVDHKIDAVNEAKQSVEQINTKTTVTESALVLQTQPANASKLYTNKCASCHGLNAEKSALNTSANISQWDSDKIQNALHGYKNGTYGGKMKAIMEAQIKPLSDEEIKQLSNYITLL